MNNAGMRITLTLGTLVLALVFACAPAQAERYIVEPIVETVSQSEQGFTQAELDQMLAPIALYPDSLLSQVLIAATYPLEVVEAARWSRRNSQLEGEAAVAAIADREWDPSVKSLVAFPDLLARLDEDLEWTRNLGDAMLFQEEQVMDSIQFLRARADAAGSLESTEYVRVVREEKTIIIEPARTRIVHVPYYDPYIVYGSWWRPAYPPVMWAPPAYYYYGHPGFYWGSGISISAGFFHSSFYWPHRSVVIVHAPRYYAPPRYRPYRPYYQPGQRWEHNPWHRRGVAYRQPLVRERYSHHHAGPAPSPRWSGTQRPPRDDRHIGRTGREAAAQPRLPEDRVRNERLEGRGGGTEVQNRYDATERRRAGSGAVPGSEASAVTRQRTPADRFMDRSASEAAAQRQARPDAASLERAMRASEATRPQASRAQPTQRAGVASGAQPAQRPAAAPGIPPQATHRASGPARAPQGTRPQDALRAPQARPTTPAAAAAPPPAATPGPAPRSRSSGRGSAEQDAAVNPRAGASGQESRRGR
jgi:hypothetical protein